MPKRGGRPSPVRQMEDDLKSRLRIGESRHKAKQDRDYWESEGKYCFYSWKSFNDALSIGCRLINYCRGEHPGIRDYRECLRYANEWLLSDPKWAATTLDTYKSGLAKIFRRPSSEFIRTPERRREDITRSRNVTKSDAHFREENHAEFVAFCRTAGPRRNEICLLRGSDLVWLKGKPYIHYVRGTKNGKRRRAPLTGTPGEVRAVVDRMREAGDGKVWPEVPVHADIHSFRADSWNDCLQSFLGMALQAIPQHARRLYGKHARTLEECRAEPFFNPQKYNGKGKPKGGWERNCVYWLRGKHKGEWLDKKAMLIVSRALGHNRIDVIAGHYLGL